MLVRHLISPWVSVEVWEHFCPLLDHSFLFILWRDLGGVHSRPSDKEAAFVANAVSGVKCEWNRNKWNMHTHTHKMQMYTLTTTKGISFPKVTKLFLVSVFQLAPGIELTMTTIHYIRVLLVLRIVVQILTDVWHSNNQHIYEIKACLLHLSIVLGFQLSFLYVSYDLNMSLGWLLQ